MINILDIYYDLSKDTISDTENGFLPIDTFNRYSKRAELRLLNWLAGDEDAEEQVPPSIQRDRDWLAHLITTEPSNVSKGIVLRPESYYRYEGLSYLTKKDDCGDDEPEIVRNPISILDGPEFNDRLSTFIEELKPENSPIAKRSKDGFKVAPIDLGNVELEYIAYPDYGVIIKMLDNQYNNEVPDPKLSKNYAWPEAARDALIYFMAGYFGVRDRDTDLLQQNELVNKTKK